jgi:CDP-glycerol glycerophosphotransferase
MPRISVVVPVHDVEDYVATCLQSLARQTYRDLEVVVVDDGSTDRSAEIAARFCAGDSRFRLIRQANAGLGAARNAGTDAASGELLAFVDSDDVVPDAAYERLADTLRVSGSDFATGNVQRLTRQGATQAQFLARTFSKRRVATHVSKDRTLLADRTAWNKLWRRSFWDEHGLRFPEGVVHEDIPVTLPAHVLAARVDVLAAPVYQWRLREDGAASITQRRLEYGVLVDRLAAIEQVRRFLRDRGSRKLARWYDASIVADDLRLHLNVLDMADERYRARFMTDVNCMLDEVPARVFDRLPAIERLKWHLLRRERMPELVEVVRFHNQRGASIPAVRHRGRYEGGYPFRRDERLAIPPHTFRLGRRDEDLALTPHLAAVEAAGPRLILRGRSEINALPGPARSAIVALAPGRLQSLQLRVNPVRVPTDGVSEFAAVLDVRELRRGGAWQEGTWKLFVVGHTGSVRRRRGRFDLDSAQLLGAIDLDAGEDVHACARVGTDGTVAVVIRTRWAQLLAARRRGAVIDLRCRLHGIGHEPLLELRRRTDGRVLRYPLHGTDGERRARVPVRDLRSAPAPLEAIATGMLEQHDIWAASVAAPGGVFDLAALRSDAGAHDGDIAVARARGGGVEVIVGTPAQLPAPARWPSAVR